MRYEAMLAETVCMRGHQADEIDAYLARPLGAGPYPGSCRHPSYARLGRGEQRNCP